MFTGVFCDINIEMVLCFDYKDVLLFKKSFLGFHYGLYGSFKNCRDFFPRPRGIKVFYLYLFFFSYGGFFEEI